MSPYISTTVVAASAAESPTPPSSPSASSASTAPTSRARMLIRLEVHFDILCPWSYIQKRSLDQAMAGVQAKNPDVEFELLWRPYYLYPQLHTGCEKESLYANSMDADRLREWHAKVQAAASRYGISFRPTGRTGPSRQAHVLVQLALQQRGPGPAQDALVETLFHGHFVEGHDVFDEDWLLEVGVRAGLDEADVRGALGSGVAARDVDEGVVSAEVELGVRAVPCLTAQGRYRVGGFQETKVFEDLFDKICCEEII